MSKTDSKAATDMTEAMEKTMQQLHGRFQAVSAQLESKNILYMFVCVTVTVYIQTTADNSTFTPPRLSVWVVSTSKEKTCTAPVRMSFTSALDEMGTRIGDLEKNVAELMTQAGMEEQAISK
ncbi:Heat shock factor-binding protein 1 [Collichthys lucidus]|uniref:Heat shock factor-binding protein 1 n=1 Tax=Collichthys lucidus TaxID=240159 RepID=A0A4U5VM20_COLLU|nr:Heat shock factor-binding protein 1 [Collichthys lucidus]